MTRRQRSALTLKQAAFVAAYRGDATAAARAAGYSAASETALRVAAHKLMKHPQVRVALEASGKLRAGSTKASTKASTKSQRPPKGASTKASTKASTAPARAPAPPAPASPPASPPTDPTTYDAERTLLQIIDAKSTRDADRLRAIGQLEQLRADRAEAEERASEAEAAAAPARLASSPFVIWFDNGRVPPPPGAVADMARRLSGPDRRALVAELTAGVTPEEPAAPAAPAEEPGS